MYMLSSVRPCVRASVRLSVSVVTRNSAPLDKISKSPFPTISRFRSLSLLLPLHDKKGSPYSITERRVPELIPVLGSQPAGDVNHIKPGGRLPLLSARPQIYYLRNLERADTNFDAW